MSKTPFIFEGCFLMGKFMPYAGEACQPLYRMALAGQVGVYWLVWILGTGSKWKKGCSNVLCWNIP